MTHKYATEFSAVLAASIAEVALYTIKHHATSKKAAADIASIALRVIERELTEDRQVAGGQVRYIFEERP